MLTIIKHLFNEHGSQIIRFGIVGIAAAITHVLTVIFLVEHQWMQPLIANIFGYLLAFQVSYFGHRHFTFQHSAPISETIGRFVIVATIGFSFNESLFYLFLHYFNQYYPIALLLTLTITPLMTFILGKLWVFPRLQDPCQK